MKSSTLTSLICILTSSILRETICILPGAQVRLTNAGFDYGVNIAVSELTKKLQGSKIGDLHGGGSGLSYDFTQLVIPQFSIGQKSIRPYRGNGLLWHLGSVSISLNGNYHYKYKKLFIRVSDHGSFRVSASGLFIDLHVKVTANTATKRPMIQSVSCSCHINDIHVRFTGGKAKWLYNLLASMAKGRIKKLIQNAVCKAANKAVNEDGNNALKELKITTPVAKFFTLDYGFISNPKFPPQYMETYHKGEVYWTNDHQPYTHSPKQFAPLSNTTKMVYLWLSDYIANSFAFSAFKHDILHYNLTADELEAKDRKLLNTTCPDAFPPCIGTIIPQIGKHYPNSTVKMQINATTAPVVQMSREKLMISGKGEIKMYAITKNKMEHFMLHLGLDLAVTGKAWVKDDKIYARVNDISMKFTLIKSAIGSDVKVVVLNAMAKVIAGVFVKRQLNDLGEKGFNLPISGPVKFKDPKLTIVENAIIISSDIIYVGKQKKEPKSPWLDEDRTMEVVDGNTHLQSVML